MQKTDEKTNLIDKKDMYDILFNYEFPEFSVTEETKKDVLEHPERYIGCDYRIRAGLFRTEQETQKYIEDSLKRPLPSEKPKVKTLSKGFFQRKNR